MGNPGDEDSRVDLAIKTNEWTLRHLIALLEARLPHTDYSIV